MWHRRGSERDLLLREDPLPPRRRPLPMRGGRYRLLNCIDFWMPVCAEERLVTGPQRGYFVQRCENVGMKLITSRDPAQVGVGDRAATARSTRRRNIEQRLAAPPRLRAY